MSTKTPPKGAKKSEAAKQAAKMAKKATGTVHLALLLDESGSMGGKEEAVITGTNEFLDTFRKLEGADVRVWLATFDEYLTEPRVRTKFDGVKLKKVTNLERGDYTPRGRTPLYDAVLDTLADMERRAGDDDRAFVVVLTDGWENASEASAETVQKAVKKAEKRGWGFLYLGADHDNLEASAAIGLGAKGQSFAFTSSPVGTQSALRAGARGATAYFMAENASVYAAAAADSYDATGGVIPEALDEDKDDDES